MELSVKVLDILFRRIDPEVLLRSLLNGSLGSSANSLETLFSSYAETTLSGYSQNEQDNIYTWIQQKLQSHQQSVTLPPFALLADFGQDVLSITPQGPACKYSEVLNWRDCYLLLGQDSIITAWLAGYAKSRRRPGNYSWDVVIPSDNSFLNQQLAGLAENHLHFYASASTFSLNWCCVMNRTSRVTATDKELKWLDDLLQQHTTRRLGSASWNMRRRLVYAAKLRLLLFRKISESPEHEIIFDDFRRFHNSYSGEMFESVKIEKEAGWLRFVFGLPFSQPDGNFVCLDYAFTQDLQNDLEEDFRLPAAERRFLYECYDRCFDGRFDVTSQWMFYCYLLLKSQFRSELIQLNKQTGFQNFHDYDSRKYKLWKDMSEYWSEDYRQGLNGVLNKQNLSTLEGRLSPQESIHKNIDTVYQIDRAKLFYDAPSSHERRDISSWRMSRYMDNHAKAQPYYFLLHFPKRADNLQETGAYCRHYSYRQSVRNLAIKIAETLSASDYYCQRVLGIDACSNEIVCRPEIFSQAFRFLREFPVQYYRRDALSFRTPLLRATYHVGEDFLDIADGLRAIDEAIRFLELRRGDRLGHALALGVSAELHYNHKHNLIPIPAQVFLDNLVWCIYRSVELNVNIDANLRNSLEYQAQCQFNNLYHDFVPTANLADYYHSMFLRGDIPQCYRSGRYVEAVPLTDPFDLFATCRCPEISLQLEQYRKEQNACELYRAYHFNSNVKRKGNVIVTFEIKPEYRNLMKQLQAAMQNLVNQNGLSIECNPSSNVLIGSFEDYTNHPIFTFNHSGLNMDTPDPRMHVSINTDDPGIFDTSLTFEYTVLSAALAQDTDDHGKRKHTDREIEDYLRTLIRMGQEQRFMEWPPRA